MTMPVWDMVQSIMQTTRDPSAPFRVMFNGQFLGIEDMYRDGRGGVVLVVSDVVE